MPCGPGASGADARAALSLVFNAFGAPQPHEPAPSPVSPRRELFWPARLNFRKPLQRHRGRARRRSERLQPGFYDRRQQPLPRRIHPRMCQLLCAEARMRHDDCATVQSHPGLLYSVLAFAFDTGVNDTNSRRSAPMALFHGAEPLDHRECTQSSPAPCAPAVLRAALANIFVASIWSAPRGIKRCTLDIRDFGTTEP